MEKKSNKGLTIFIVSLIVIVFIVLTFLLKSEFKVEKNDKIAVIPINGAIDAGNGDGGFFTQGGVSASDIISYIDAANKDKSVKAIILSINSPGGGVVASEEIVNAVKKTNKPVVALIRDIGASGAYWIASASDYIIADPMSVTGSIGVIGSYLDFSDLFAKYGVKYQRITSGEYKDLGTPYANLTDDQRMILLGKLSKIHKYFIDDVNKNRKRDLTKYATGLFYLGIEAKQNGLVDELGSKDEAINEAMKLANMSSYELAVYTKQSSILDLLQKLSYSFGFSVGEGIGSQLNAKSSVDLRLE